MVEINLPFTCRQGWIGLGVMTFILCLIPIIANHNDIGVSFMPMLFWWVAFITVMFCITAEERGWSFPSINCRCDRK